MCSAEELLIRTQESAKRHCGCPSPAFVEAFWIAKQNRSRKPYSLKSASAGVLRKIELVRASYVCHVSSSDTLSNTLLQTCITVCESSYRCFALDQQLGC